MDNFIKITTGWVRQYFERNEAGVFVCTGQEFETGDLCECEDDGGNLIDPQEYQYQPYDMVQPESSIVDCDHCQKCGSTVCGNDTIQFRCFEPF